MRKMRIFAIAAAALLLGANFPAPAEDQIGEILYLDDEVEIVRNSETIYPEDVFIGMEIENYDLLSTDAYGFAEIGIDSPRSPEMNLKVSPNTTFYFEVNKIGQTEKTTLEMLSGALSLKVKKIAGAREVEVKSESATMGVRGTSFDVAANPAGEVLITCPEGRVSCRDDEGNELFAEPGQIVEKRPGELFRRIPVAVSDLETFRREWYAERLEVFKANALKAIKAYASRYSELKQGYESAYQELIQERETLNKWYAEERRKSIGSRMEIMREKKKLIGHLLKIRKNLFLFERVYFRLVELEDYYRQGYGRGLIRPGLSSADFFKAFNRDRRKLSEKMARVRFIIKLYAKRNGGSFPTDLFSGDEEEDFFADEDDFSF